MSSRRCLKAAVVALVITSLFAGPGISAVVAEEPAVLGASVIASGGCTLVRDACRRPVDLVICLDTSGSMTALIDSARSKLWDIVNELATAHPTPHLRVGLLTYGTPHNSTAYGGWIVRQTDLTDDLDAVYAKMMEMSTSGGDEYVGWVLHEALSTMSWSPAPGALKIVFVAGNESADQAKEKFNFRYVAEKARARGIFINAIYAGGRNQGVAENWHEVAIHGGGDFSAIDMQHGTVQMATPQDKILIQLNAELNATYVPFGKRGRAAKKNQVAQDAHAEQLGVQSSASRVVAKAGVLYRNTAWDLVDASQEKDFKLAEVADEELPENMRPMTPKERQAYLEGVIAARKAVQKKVKEVSAARRAFLEEERKKHAGKVGLDDAITKALREQAQSKGFAFDAGEAE